MAQSLNITRQTSVQDLQSFLEREGASDQSRLRGTKTANGGYTLYIDNKSSSMFDRIRQKAHDRNKAAEAGIKMVFKNFEGLAQQNGVDRGHKGAGQMLQRIDRRTDLEGRHALRGDQVLNLAKGAALIGAKLGLHPGALPPPTDNARALTSARGPQIALNLTATQKSRLGDAVRGADSDAGREAAIQAMADVALAAIGGAGLSAEIERALAMSLGESVKFQIRDAVSDQLGAHGEPLASDFETMLDKAFDRAGSAILGTRQVGDAVPTTIVKQGIDTTVDLPVIEIKGKQYEAKRYLGEGGFGDVYLYVNQRDLTDTVAFKICKTDNFGRSAEVVRGETAQEVLSHDKAVASGSNNVLKLEGAVRLSAGTIGIALESAPNGSVFDMAKSLNAHIGNGPGQLTSAEAKVVRLTVLQGLIQGLKAMQDQGLMHLDFKSPNCLIGADGRTKVIDFGTLKEATSIGAKDLPSGVQNPRFLSPEFMAAKKAANDLATARGGGMTDAMTPAMTLMFPNLKTESQKTLASMLSKDVSDKTLAKAYDVLDQKLDGAHDVWGAGLSALELFAGRELLSEISFASTVEDTVVDWASDPTNTALSPQITGPLPRNADGHALAIGRSTGDTQVDDLINKMLAPDPKDRISLEDALKHPAFRTAGVGDPAVLAFIPKLLVDPKPFDDKTSLEADIRDQTLLLDGKLVAVGGPDLLTQDVQLLTSGTATRAERDRIFASLSPDKQAQLQRAYDKLSGSLDRLPVVNQMIVTAEVAIATAKTGLDAIINPPLRDARQGQTII